MTFVNIYWDFLDLKYTLAINCIPLVHVQAVFLLDNGKVRISMNQYIVRDVFRRSRNITKLFCVINETELIEFIKLYDVSFSLNKFTLNALNTSLLLLPLGDAIVGFFQFNPLC